MTRPDAPAAPAAGSAARPARAPAARCRRLPPAAAGAGPSRRALRGPRPARPPFLAAAALLALAATVASVPAAAVAAAVGAGARPSACGAAPGPPTAEARLLCDAYQPDTSDWIVGLRRQLHQIPELMFEEVKTSAAVRAALDELGIEYTHPVAKTGIVGRVGPPPYRVALRADMDALPIEEGAQPPFRSRHPGRMHACGHDGHMAMLLGAARLLKAREAEISAAGRGGVLLLFQPAEEGGGGAYDVVAEGALDGIEAIFGLHLWPGSPSDGGTIATRPGPMMAASTRFGVTLVGRGGHAAIPHKAVDPVVAAAQVIMALQLLVSRETSPTESAVISVTRVNTGPGATNVIPPSIELGGSLRALDPAVFSRLRRRIPEVVNATAAASGVAAGPWSWSARPYPPVVNDAALAALAAEVGGRLAEAAEAAAAAAGGEAGAAANGTGAAAAGAVRYAPLAEPSLAAEDFSVYSANMPACFVFLGFEAVIGDDGAPANLHNPQFALDERRLPLGAALHAGLALRALEVRGPAATRAEGSAPPEEL